MWGLCPPSSNADVLDSVLPIPSVSVSLGACPEDWTYPISNPSNLVQSCAQVVWACECHESYFLFRAGLSLEG